MEKLFTRTLGALFLSLLFFYAAAEVHAVSFTRKVFLQNATPNSMEFRWVTDTHEALIVKYGTTTSYGSQVNSDTVTGTGGPMNHAKISGLLPNTTYFYQVTTSSGTSVTPAGDQTYHFKTSPPIGATTPFTWAIWGDSGNNSSSQDAVAKALYSKNPDLVLIAGDIAYPYSADFANNNLKYFSHYMDGLIPTQNITGQYTMKFAPFYVTCGNHETSCPTVMADHSLPGGGNMGGQISSYSWDYGNVHFVALNSNGSFNYTSGCSACDPQTRWAYNDLRASNQPWKVLYWHHNGWSAGSHATQGNIVTNLMKLAKDAGADVAAWGHSHVYERWPTNVAGYEGVQFFTIGNGGQTGGSNCKSITPNCVAGSGINGLSNAGFLWFQVNGNTMTANYVGSGGQIQDSIALNSNGAGPTGPASTNTPTPTRSPNATNTPTRPPNTTNTPIPTTTANCTGNPYPGDSNNDGRVDGVDFVAWLNHYFRAFSCAANGDFNKNGFVDGVDYSIWLFNYGHGLPTGVQTPTPTRSPNATNTPTPRTGSTGTPLPTQPPVSGDFPCGKYPNANPGCINVSYQSWFDDVPGTPETMNVNYTPKLLHQHYECALPAARANGQYLRQGMKIVCNLLKYNSIVPSLPSNSGWVRAQNVGNTYEQFNLNWPACQNTKYEGKECKIEVVQTLRDSDMKQNTEIRLTPNAEFIGMGGKRHFLSTNFDSGIGYAPTSELRGKYWIAECGDYLRMEVHQIDKFYKGNEAIPTVSGTIQIPIDANGGCGSNHKTFVFLDPSQHVRVPGTQTGTTLMEYNGQFVGNLSWDTTKTTNGIHSVLFIDMEGGANYVSAGGVALKYNVQN